MVIVCQLSDDHSVFLEGFKMTILNRPDHLFLQRTFLTLVAVSLVPLICLITLGVYQVVLTVKIRDDASRAKESTINFGYFDELIQALQVCNIPWDIPVLLIFPRLITDKGDPTVYLHFGVLSHLFGLHFNFTIIVNSCQSVR